MIDRVVLVLLVIKVSKLAQASAKYVIKGGMKADGIVEKSDIIGAIFGQTEGLLGPDLDLRELQKTGRIGRINVEVNTENGSAEADITIPTSLDATETALIAAGLETIERIGPCNAKIEVDRVEDVRVTKRDYIVKRAKNLLSNMQKAVPRSQEITEEIKREIRKSEIVEYKGLPAGPEVETSDSVVVVEGRADVINLLKNGVKNAVATGGTDIPDEIKKIAKEKVVTVFLDGDRGGDLILKELNQITDVDYVSKAPKDKEVEELTKKQIYKALRDKMSLEQFTEIDKTGENSIEPPEEEEARQFKEIMEDLVGTRALYVLDNDLETLGRVPINEAFSNLGEMNKVYAILFDGYIDNKFISLAEEKGAEYLIGMSKEENLRESKVRYFTQKELEKV